MKFKLVIIFLILNFSSLAQNLVLNPGFEDYLPHKYYPPIFYGDTFYAKNWYNIYQGYPSKVNHYFENNIIPLPDGSYRKTNNVPENHLGHHPAHSGKAYVGLGLIALDGQMCHITGILGESLIKDQEYEVSFFLKFPGEMCAIYNNKIEIKFITLKDSSSFIMKENTSEDDANYEKLFKNIRTDSDMVFSDMNGFNDSTTWIKLTEIYKARGDEKYIIIGLFYQGEEISRKIEIMRKEYLKVYTSNKKRLKFIKKINKMKINFIRYNKNFNFIRFKTIHPSGVDSCYYLIDDVSVIPLKSTND